MLSVIYGKGLIWGMWFPDLVAFKQKTGTPTKIMIGKKSLVIQPVYFANAINKREMCFYDTHIHMLKADVQIDLNKLLGCN